MTDLLLVRHGQATHNLENRWEGWSEHPLTPAGQRQVASLARRLADWSPAITHIWSSPLLRARQTAEAIARQLGLPVITHDGLREIHFGQVGGLTMEGFCDTMPRVFARWQNRSDLTFQFPGGEQRLAFFQRVGQALDEIMANAPDEQVVVVAHGGTLRAGFAHLFPDSMGDWWAYALNNASVSHVRVGGESNVLVTLNDCQHLDGREQNEQSATERAA